MELAKVREQTEQLRQGLRRVFYGQPEILDLLLATV